MRPQFHAIISVVVVVLLASVLHVPNKSLLGWLLLGVLAGTLIDLDHIWIGFLLNKQAMVDNVTDFSPVSLYADFRPGGRLYTDTLQKLLIYFSLHTVTIGVVLLLLPLLFLEYLPATACVFVHWLCDIPQVARTYLNLKRLNGDQ